jgi:hypothetical protein
LRNALSGWHRDVCVLAALCSAPSDVIAAEMKQVVDLIVG